ncbi:unnamed protein product [Candidula unifasciata]|uniref:Alpha-carbonic anhydrase domain-containing protein n=1 Tax=Candidula unifasciata TaxID=100452 RepID=A0A8S3ZRF0_9EUPU|nr:unnamed protein product [Candidula unifasciata]
MMLIKSFFPTFSALSGIHGKNLDTIWSFTVKRYAGGSIGWSYLNQDTWHTENYTCSSDTNEPHSPINIFTKRTTRRTFKPFKFTNYDNKDLKMVLGNNGHLVKIDFPETQAEMTGGGHPEDFTVDHIHFHWGKKSTQGSEHFKNGTSFPMEMHIVHFNAIYPSLYDAEGQPSGLAVFAFLFELSRDPNPALTPIVGRLQEVRTPYTAVDLKLPSLATILPGNMDEFYQYTDGGLRGFPCITWTIFRETIKISESQLEKFRTLESSEGGNLEGNHRDPQDIPGVQVVSSYEVPASENTTQGSAFSKLIYKLVCGRSKNSKSPF